MPSRRFASGKPGDYEGMSDVVNRFDFNVIGLPIFGLEEIVRC